VTVGRRVLTAPRRIAKSPPHQDKPLTRYVAGKFDYHFFARSANFHRWRTQHRRTSRGGIALKNSNGTTSKMNLTRIVRNSIGTATPWVLAILFFLGFYGFVGPASTSAATVGESVSTATGDATKTLKEGEKVALTKIEQIWQRIDERRLKNRTRDELVAWVIMGLLVGGLLSRVSNAKPVTSFLFGLIGAFVGGIVAHVAQLDFGLGPVLIRYEDLLCSFVGGALLLLIGRVVTARKSPKK
jgi:uncharacterized membrane protein YeaQ/YmgE (transglycosylase-associated protein family)